ncbi:MAG TPA: glycogen/starch/alpha-glucan phosphorylase [Methylomusa anaerophila]|uniref:Alpha-1,4 glucan phosphorylase n=1 Tax=Methylomusa anaerophila TaxID=1930071 RepID=A0A348AHW9_9FIRM|nr:glycogen/starch/alpha-glucan phosphorylase [Methylomusa anaerophila]BBB90667.1 glycogen phosphorylase [Methylomusa anaerophila]HML88726.1 glycogen/starch/alpha-glucan phosphorylase [Methylomusa anaerophila]
MLTKDECKTALPKRLLTLTGASLEEASAADKYAALASLVRDYIGQSWVDTTRRYDNQRQKQVYYFSIEFLPGRLLDTNLRNLDIREVWREALAELGIDYTELTNAEQDAGLGNGGLGRLAACFLDSLASLGLPGHGCGIRYTYGLFEQAIVDGMQVEKPDTWLKELNIWEYRKAGKAVLVKFGPPLGGVKAVPYDIPVIGFDNRTVNTLRLWSAEVRDGFNVNYSSFGPDDYRKLLEYKSWVESISQILYPDDRYEEGRQLRLVQEYFLVSAGLQSIVRHIKRKQGPDLSHLADQIAIHINDTHPALAIPELMRILMDEEGLGWDKAWDITTHTISYTNHTVLPEALEKWPVGQIQSLLPRIYEIIHEINERFCAQLWQRYPGDWGRIAAMAVIGDCFVKMAHLAIVGSHSVNGVAELHSQILQSDLFSRFYQHTPQKFNNKTNGITHRRWLLSANPGLAGLITDTIGPGWLQRPNDLEKLLPFAADTAFQQKLAAVKQERKEALANYIFNKYRLALDPHSLFDVQVKRIHAYKRQLLNALRIMELYQRLKANPGLDILPRTFIFAGKAAPGYYLAKKIIQLIVTLSKQINNDTAIQDKLKVIFLENYNVSLAERIIPAADISEQISTAGKEASGTGNMKFMMNGAITVGTLDGANVEIREAVGDENIVIFGLTAGETAACYQTGRCNPLTIYNQDERVRNCVNQLIDGSLPVFGDEFRPLYDYLLHPGGAFLELQDFAAYLEAQTRIDRLFHDNPARWQAAATNIARSGRFSSDRTITEYANGIWHIHP